MYLAFSESPLWFSHLCSCDLAKFYLLFWIIQKSVIFAFSVLKKKISFPFFQVLAKASACFSRLSGLSYSFLWMLFHEWLPLRLCGLTHSLIVFLPLIILLWANLMKLSLTIPFSLSLKAFINVTKISWEETQISIACSHRWASPKSLFTIYCWNNIFLLITWLPCLTDSLSQARDHLGWTMPDKSCWTMV